MSQLFAAGATGGAAARDCAPAVPPDRHILLRFVWHAWSARKPTIWLYILGAGAQEKYPPLPYFQGRWSNGHVYTEYLANALGLRLVNNAVGGATTGAYNNSVLNVVGSFPDPRRCQPPGSPPGCPAQVRALVYSRSVSSV